MNQDFNSKEHNHTDKRITNPAKRNQFNWCPTCNDWFEPIGMREYHPTDEQCRAAERRAMGIHG